MRHGILGKQMLNVVSQSKASRMGQGYRGFNLVVMPRLLCLWGVEFGELVQASIEHRTILRHSFPCTTALDREIVKVLFPTRPISRPLMTLSGTIQRRLLSVHQFGSSVSKRAGKERVWRPNSCNVPSMSPSVRSHQFVGSPEPHCFSTKQSAPVSLHMLVWLSFPRSPRPSFHSLNHRAVNKPDWPIELCRWCPCLSRPKEYLYNSQVKQRQA